MCSYYHFGLSPWVVSLGGQGLIEVDTVIAVVPDHSDVMVDDSDVLEAPLAGLIGVVLVSWEMGRGWPI